MSWWSQSVEDWILKEGLQQGGKRLMVNLTWPQDHSCCGHDNDTSATPLIWDPEEHRPNICPPVTDRVAQRMFGCKTSLSKSITPTWLKRVKHDFFSLYLSRSAKICCKLGCFSDTKNIHSINLEKTKERGLIYTSQWLRWKMFAFNWSKIKQ